MSVLHRDDESGSQEVSFWAVQQHVEPTLARVGSWPMLGTPAWRALPDDDPRKTAALLDAARHWSLRLECNQDAVRQAGEDISEALEWSDIAQRNRAEREWREAHPWALPGSAA